jgi:hypothetical protein
VAGMNRGEITIFEDRFRSQRCICAQRGQAKINIVHVPLTLDPPNFVFSKKPFCGLTRVCYLSVGVKLLRSKAEIKKPCKINTCAIPQSIEEKQVAYLVCNSYDVLV